MHFFTYFSGREPASIVNAMGTTRAERGRPHPRSIRAYIIIIRVVSRRNGGAYIQYITRTNYCTSAVVTNRAFILYGPIGMLDENRKN